MVDWRFIRPALVAPILALGLAAPSPASAHQSFDAWLRAVRTEALRAGIGKKTVDTAFHGLKPDPRVIALDRKQPEFHLTFAQYMDRVATPEMVARGRQAYRRNRELLAKITGRYGVPASIIVALWGIESRYGSRTGKFRVVRSLATLAHDGRRSVYFHKELIAALRILDRGDIRYDDMTGSWAGAMGQNQFMPTSFLAYAADQDGDGRRDIWTSRADVFASAANYLSRHGWRAGERWGRPVRLPDGFDPAQARGRRHISAWKAMGVRSDDSGDDLVASLLMPSGPKGPAFFAYHNFDVILSWNNSSYFGLAVGTLADLVER